MVKRTEAETPGPHEVSLKAGLFHVAISFNVFDCRIRGGGEEGSEGGGSNFVMLYFTNGLSLKES